MRTPKALRGVLLLSLLAAVCIVVGGCGGGGGGAASTVIGLIYNASTLNPVIGAQAQISGRQSAPTGVQGAFTISGVAAGTRTLTVSAVGYQTINQQVVISTGTTNLGPVYLPEVTTPGLGHVSGIVRDAGVPVAGAIVAVGGKTARTKPNGSFLVFNLPPGAALVTVQSGVKLGRGSVQVVQNVTTNVDIGLSFSPPLPPAI